MTFRPHRLRVPEAATCRFTRGLGREPRRFVLPFAHLQMVVQLLIDVPVDIRPPEAEVPPPERLAYHAHLLRRLAVRPEHLAHRVGEAHPRRRFTLQLLPAAGGKHVELRAPVVLRRPPFSLDPPLVF